MLKCKLTKICNKNKDLFISAFLLAFVIHFYILSNYIPNHDNLAGIVSDLDLTTSGRWLSKCITRLSSIYTMHAVNGVICIGLISISGVLLIEILEITRQYLKYIILALMVTFPTIAGILSYMQTADGYAVAIFLSVLGCYFLQHKSKIGYAGAVCCFTLSCGIYQAYITFSIGIIYLLFLKELFIYGTISQNTSHYTPPLY